MKIALVQYRPVTGDVARSIARHVEFIERAAAQRADLVVFPELSLTSYEPALARELAMDVADPRLDVFKSISDARGMVIGVGAPTRSPAGVHISLVLFRPGEPRAVYSKSWLHPDEDPFFVPRQGITGFTRNGTRVALAICYELSVPEHAARAAAEGAGVYLASVAKHADGVVKAHARLAEIARTHRIPALMANCVGPMDNFIAAGGSAVWDAEGSVVERMDEAEEGIVLFDGVPDLPEVSGQPLTRLWQRSPSSESRDQAGT